MKIKQFSLSFIIMSQAISFKFMRVAFNSVVIKWKWCFSSVLLNGDKSPSPNSDCRYLKFFIVVVSSIFLMNGICHADIYIYIDEKGNQHFSEEKKHNNYRLLLRSKQNAAPATFKNWKEKSYRYVRVPKNKTLQYKYHPIIVRAAEKHGLEPEFIHAVITAESAYQHKIVSHAGAQGLMQLMPQTAKRFGVSDSFDPHQNINAGTFYLKKLLAEFKTKELALAGYNAGEGAVRRYNNTIPPYKETQGYVEKVMGFYWYYKDNMSASIYLK